MTEETRVQFTDLGLPEPLMEGVRAAGFEVCTPIQAETLPIALKGGEIVEDELSVANAHPSGARPFGREDYIRKFEALAEEVATGAERRRFTGAAQGLEGLGAGELSALGVEAAPGVLQLSGRVEGGIF